MSASEAMPRSPRADSMRGPTPRSSTTGLERRSVRVVRAGSETPAAPVLEVGHAIGSEADVGPDDAADLGDELLLDAEVLGELGDELRRRDVPEVERAPGLDGGPDLVDYGGHLPLASAGALEGRDLSIRYLQHGPDVERRPDQALRPADAPAPGQVLERTHRKEHLHPRDGPLRDAFDLLEIPAFVDTAERLQQDQTRPHLRGPRVEDMDGTIDHPCRLQGRVVGAAELGRKGEDQDVVVVGERLVGLHES